ncbi:MAG TPA: hypothetical protein VFH68_11925 [Polyangia bacterium]|nr:hypothetical protein [Polyangia bacterium]
MISAKKFGGRHTEEPRAWAFLSGPQRAKRLFADQRLVAAQATPHHAPS